MIDFTIKPGTKVFCMVKSPVPILNYIEFTQGELVYCVDNGKEIYIKGDIAVTTITEDEVKVNVQKYVRWVDMEILVLTDEVGDIQWNYRNLEEYIVDTKNLNFKCNPVREGTKPTKKQFK
ncbi:hypothetical protein SAMN06265371_101271 [Lutibacter agarilyticus]|uniref:Uncharacterized protein n=1 Tax=Lutibacter agarilyticus TaxID=1109740 RepID=A0A238VFY5_9FLAO|nr:hypothetical protein [Lutibacter agarilyticus]SNR32429.1 hypothetical protein SAMN06265371_101271 [Lutibacter agarilyticus]